MEGEPFYLEGEEVERYENESLYSWQSENECLNQKWSEWSAEFPGMKSRNQRKKPPKNAFTVTRLSDLCSKVIAHKMSFEQIEVKWNLVRKEALPAPILNKVLKFCFPADLEAIKTYSFIANGSTETFAEARTYYNEGCVGTVYQIGYHISAQVKSLEDDSQRIPYLDEEKPCYSVSVMVDRCRIVSCECSCTEGSSWCPHVMAMCIFRVSRPDEVLYRPPIWDTINYLSDQKLKKFAQHMINGGPSEFILLAQKLLDDLDRENSEISRSIGAPDPTAGGVEDVAIWCMEEKKLHESIRKILISFVKPAATVPCDLNYLSNNHSTQASSEFGWLLRSQQARLPDPLWRLLEIVVHMLKTGDENAANLLHSITEHCLCIDQVLSWWYQTRLLETGRWYTGMTPNRTTAQTQQNASRFAAAVLCEEIVRLWTLCALNPRLSQFEREELAGLMRLYHETAISRISHQLEFSTSELNLVDNRGVRLAAANAPFSVDCFPGFFVPLQYCYMDWQGPAMKEILESAPELSAFAEVLNDPSNAGKCTNIPLLRNGVMAVHMEIVRTEHKVAATVNRQQYYDNKARSKRYSRRKRRRRHVARGGRGNEQGARRNAANAQNPHAENPVPADGYDASGAEEEEVPGRRDQVKTKAEEFRQALELLCAEASLPLSQEAQTFACCTAALCYGFAREADCLAHILARDYTKHVSSKLEKALPTDTIKVCRHGVQAQTCSACRANQHQARRPPNRTIPSKNHLRDTAETLDHLKRTLFVVRSLIGAPVLCPLTNLPFNDLDDKCFIVNDLSAFTLALKTLLLPRRPAPTKQLEVQVVVLESELHRLLHSIKITPPMLEIIRTCAEDFLKSDSVATYVKRNSVPPVAFGNYILNALSYNYQVLNNNPKVRPPSDLMVLKHRKESDEDLAFAVALNVLQLRPQFSESDCPMLQEHMRKQKGEMTFELLKRNMDSNDRLNLILDRFLDPNIHCIYSNYNTNGIMAPACSEEKGAPFCLCWKKVERELPSYKPKPVVDKTDAPPEARGEPSAEVAPPSSQRSDDAAFVNRISDSSGSESSNYFDNAPRPLRPIPEHGRAQRQEQGGRHFHGRNRQYADPLFDEQSHFFLDFAKKVFVEGGGRQGNVTHYYPMEENAVVEVNRQLQMCAYVIGLYALGLYSKKEKWTTRTYSATSSWIASVALEIGPEAVMMAGDVYETHFTPSEAVELAEKADVKGPNFRKAAVRLTLNVLKHPWSISLLQCKRALDHCADAGSETLEKACTSIEEASTSDNATPHVLFNVARLWQGMHSTYMAANPPKVQQDPKVPYLWSPRVPPPVHPSTMPYGYADPMQGAMMNLPPATMAAPIPLHHHPSMHAHQQGPNRIMPNTSMEMTLQLVQHHRQLQQASMANLVPLAQVNHHSATMATPLRNVQLKSQPLNKQQYNKVSIGKQHFIYPTQDQSVWRLIKAFDVGLIALDKLTVAETEDQNLRFYQPYSKHNEFQIDILWLCELAVELGPTQLQRVCESAVLHVCSPVVLMQIMETGIAALVKWRNMGLDFQGDMSRFPYGRPGAASIADGVRFTLSQLNYPVFLVEVGGQCVEMVWRATAAKVMLPRCIEADMEGLMQMRRIVHNMSALLGAEGPIFYNSFIDLVKKHNNRTSRLFLEQLNNIQE